MLGTGIGGLERLCFPTSQSENLIVLLNVGWVPRAGDEFWQVARLVGLDICQDLLWFCTSVFYMSVFIRTWTRTSNRILNSSSRAAQTSADVQPHHCWSAAIQTELGIGLETWQVLRKRLDWKKLDSLGWLNQNVLGRQCPGTRGKEDATDLKWPIGAGWITYVNEVLQIVPIGKIVSEEGKLYFRIRTAKDIPLLWIEDQMVLLHRKKVSRTHLCWWSASSKKALENPLVGIIFILLNQALKEIFNLLNIGVVLHSKNELAFQQIQILFLRL